DLDDALTGAAHDDEPAVALGGERHVELGTALEAAAPHLVTHLDEDATASRADRARRKPDEGTQVRARVGQWACSSGRRNRHDLSPLGSTVGGGSFCHRWTGGSSPEKYVGGLSRTMTRDPLHDPPKPPCFT